MDPSELRMISELMIAAAIIDHVRVINGAIVMYNRLCTAANDATARTKIGDAVWTEWGTTPRACKIVVGNATEFDQRPPSRII